MQPDDEEPDHFEEPLLDPDWKEQVKEVERAREEQELVESRQFLEQTAEVLYEDKRKKILQLVDGRIKVIRGINSITYPAGTLDQIPPFSDGEPLPKNYRA